MRPIPPALRRLAPPLLGLALLGLSPGLPAAAASASPAPVEDPFGVMLPLPGCGVAGLVMSARLLHQVKLTPGRGDVAATLAADKPAARARAVAPKPPAATAPVKRRRAARQARPAPPPAAESGALAWQALYGCAAALPEEAELPLGTGPLRAT